MILISINLLTYNGSRFIENCLRSVFAQTYKNIEFLVIDNNSSDQTLGIAQKVIDGAQPIFPVRIIRNKENLGFAAGHNLGIRESKGQLVLCLNQDVWMAPDFVERAVEFFEKQVDKKIGALQPKLCRLDNDSQKTDIIDTTGLRMLKNRRIISRGQGEKDAGQYDVANEIFGVDGAAPIYLREALEDIKISVVSAHESATNQRSEYFDEDFFMYKEDVDLAWRLRLLGWKSVYVPLIKAWHSRGAGDSAATNYAAIIRERLKINKFAKYLSFKNQRLMQIKNEQLGLLMKHLIWFLPKEIASWVYVILFERYTCKAIKDLFRQAPLAWQKRKIIMSKKIIGVNEMEKWFG